MDCGSFLDDVPSLAKMVVIVNSGLPGAQLIVLTLKAKGLSDSASIVAKVSRDAIMRTLDKAYPEYGWGNNAGYGTPQHINAIQKHGITEHHRKSFTPIKNYLKEAA